MLSKVSRGDDGRIHERVHVAPLLFEVDRLILPLKMMRGERVRLMMIKTKNKRVHACARMVRAALEEMGMPYSVQEDEADLFSLISSYKRVIGEEVGRGSAVYVNLSSGGAMQAVASIYASMEFDGGVQPFFAYPKGFEPKYYGICTQDYSGVSRISVVPHFNLKMPDDGKLQFLQAVGMLGEPTKAEVLEELEMRGLVKAKGKSRPYGHVILESRFIRPLEKLGLLEVHRKGERECRLSLTEKGRNTLLINGKEKSHGK